MLRQGILALCLVTFVTFTYVMISLGGSDGVTIVGAPSAHALRVRVDAASPAAAAGLRSGDQIDLSAVSPRQRWFYASLRNGGDVQAYRVRRGNAVQTVQATVRGYSYGALRLVDWLATAGTLWLLIFAFVLALRANAQNRSLIFAAILVCWALGGLWWRENLWLPWPAVSATLDILNKVINVASIVLLVRYMAIFARADRSLDVLAWTTYAFCAGHLALGVVEVVSIFSGYAPAQALSLPLEQTCYASGLLFAALTVFVAIPRIERERRASVAWATVPLAVMYICEASSVYTMAAFPQQLYGGVLSWTTVAFDVSAIAAPVFLMYASFTRRVADIGFALNRAAIFSGVSIIIVGTFVLIESLIGEWMQRASHSENVAISATIVVALGLSIRFLHRRVEVVVDNVFFRKRHADEAALRAFAGEAPYIRSREALLERTVAVFDTHLDASFVHLLLDDGSGTYGNVDENDPALVRLRAHHAALDLHSLPTTIAGERAYPMVARGRLIGALVVGPKRSGEHYAPDESDAVAHVAQSVAGALDTLDAVATDPLAKIQERLDSIVLLLKSNVENRV